MNNFSTAVSCLFLLLLIAACNEQEDGLQVAKAEDEVQSRADSLVGGLYFGMQSREFFEHCWEAHTEGRMREGMGGFVQMSVPDSLFRGGGVIEFYPNFDSLGSIVSLPGRVRANLWSPGAKDLHPAQIAEPIMRFFEASLPGSSFQPQVGSIEPTFVKTDGNRRLTVRAGDVYLLKFEFIDLTRTIDEQLAAPTSGTSLVPIQSPLRAE